MEKTNKIVAVVFAVLLFLVGFFLVDKGSFTGNAILNDQPLFDPLSLVGLILIVVSAALFFYMIKER